MSKKKKTFSEKIQEKLPSFLKPKKKKSQSFFWLGGVVVGFVLAMFEYFQYKKKNGFTMIELLIGLTLVGFLSTTGIYGYQTSQTRARDARRKGDLQDIKVAFEDYYNDNGCYPPADSDYLSQCGQPFFTYMSKIPCDPRSGRPYLYQPLENECKGYRVYAGLEVSDDPDSEALGCDGENGCGFSPDYNYGIASGALVYSSDGESSPSTPAPTSAPHPSPSGPIYLYACDTSGVCNQYEVGHPALQSCPVTFPQNNCNQECNNPALWCNG